MHSDDGKHTDGETEESGDSRCQHIHRYTRILSIETRDNQVWRRTDQRTHATHTRGITQRDE